MKICTVFNMYSNVKITKHQKTLSKVVLYKNLTLTVLFLTAGSRSEMALNASSTTAGGVELVKLEGRLSFLGISFSASAFLSEEIRIIQNVKCHNRLLVAK
jgi:hypothetical protein